MAELPLVQGKDGKLNTSANFQPHHQLPKCSHQHLNSDELVIERFHGTCNDALQTIKDGHHIMCKEATELLAFVGTDSE